MVLSPTTYNLLVLTSLYQNSRHSKTRGSYPKKQIMLLIILPVNIYLLGALLVITFLFGFLLRASQIKSLKKKVLELENEMLSNHADILDLQKEKSCIEQKLKEIHIPVIPITASKEEGNASKAQDATMRKMAQQGKHS
jgi:uncharacterized membrane protein YqhA